MIGTDAAVANGFGPATRLELTFSVLFMDFDLDGRLDIFQSNGHLEDQIAKVQASQSYEQSPQLFWNAGSQHPTELMKCKEADTGPDFQQPLVGRGSAYADIDDDGDLDLVIVACGQKPRLLRNDQALGNNWLRVKLEGSGANRHGLGALVTLERGNETQSRRVSPTRSYLSQVELPVTFGLELQATIDRITVQWPDGKTQKLTEVKPDQVLAVKQQD